MSGIVRQTWVVRNIIASHVPCRHTIDGQVPRGLWQTGKEYLQVENIAFFARDAEHLIIATLRDAALRLVDDARLLVKDDTLLVAKPQVGNDVGGNGEIAVQHGVYTFVCQSPRHGSVRIHGDGKICARENRLHVLDRRHTIYDSDVLMPGVVLRGRPFCRGFPAFLVDCHLGIWHPYPPAFSPFPEVCLRLGRHKDYCQQQPDD